jgi:hypothetical protein
LLGHGEGATKEKACQLSGTPGPVKSNSATTPWATGVEATLLSEAMLVFAALHEITAALRKCADGLENAGNVLAARRRKTFQPGRVISRPRFQCLWFSTGVLLLGLGAAAIAADSPLATSAWVHPGPGGKLVYKMDARGNRIPDFSNVGYRGGLVRIPDVPVKATVEPAEGDAGARIQAAIDEVGKLPPDADGRRGTVLLKKGRYPIAGTLHVHDGGVVLRGEGSGPDGTVLVATGAKQRSLIIAGRVAGHAPKDEDAETERPQPVRTSKLGHHRVVDEYVPVGATSLHLDAIEGLAVGAQIVLRRPSTAEWIHDIAMDRIPVPAGRKVVQWKPGSKDLFFNRTIVRISGNEITIDAPIMDALERKYGGAEVWRLTDDPTLPEIGIENLRGESEFVSPTDEKHGWVLVDLAAVRDSWVRDVTAVHFGYSCVNVRKNSRAITIDHCACLDPVSQITGGRRYSFALDGQLTLVEHCFARGGRHDFVMHATAAGPNVFFDCAAEDVHADAGPHHRWSVGVLYDNVRVSPPRVGAKRGDAGLNIRDRGSMGTGHGWAGANQVVWNSRAAEMIVQQPPTAQNWAIGCTADVHSGDAYWESFGHPVQPQSLYVAQLHERATAETMRSSMAK